MKRLLILCLTFYVITGGFAKTVVSSLKSLPIIATQPVTKLITNAAITTAAFSVTVASSEPVTYQWYKNGRAIAGAKSNSYIATGLTTADTAKGFHVIVTNNNGSIVSNDAYIKFILFDSSLGKGDSSIRQSEPVTFANAHTNSDNSKASIYPNPINGNFFNLSLNNVPAGNYTLNVISSKGASLFTQVINHAGGTASQKVIMNHSLTAGIYYITLTDKNGLVKFVKIMAK